MGILNKFYAKVLDQILTLKEDERGSQTLEWIGIAAVIVILVGVISTAMSQDTSIGSKVVTKFRDLIDSIGGG